MVTEYYDRVVIGGGIFGSQASIVLANEGFTVLLIEQSSRLMTRASYVNQARLHNGLHYPRSLATAHDSVARTEIFRDKYPSAVKDFRQIYAISRYNSKTSSESFLNFVQRLGVEYSISNPDLFFNRGSIDLALEVSEPTFDIEILRKLVNEELKELEKIEVLLNVAVIGTTSSSITSFCLDLSDGSRVETNGVVIASYAGINSLRSLFELDPLPLKFEIAEVLIGETDPKFVGYGFTIMDGPFASMMPFGDSKKVSLTSVGMTPILKAVGLPEFSCQLNRSGCTPIQLADCNQCEVRPISGLVHQIQQMKMFMKLPKFFTQTGSLMTIKTILSSSEIDDARPTFVNKEQDRNIWTVFSGKLTSCLDLKKGLL